jgi:limonene-1,2-epoxide hydrolase
MKQGAKICRIIQKSKRKVLPTRDSRREFLRGIATGGAGLALIGARQSGNTIEIRRSKMESPIDVVRRFCRAWSDNVGTAELAAFFTDDAVYHNIPLAPVNGREAIAKHISSFIRPGAPGIESIQFHIINIADKGPIVMTERVDAFKLPHKSFELPVMGTFQISDGKIKAWRDYFDTNQFNARMENRNSTSKPHRSMAKCP